MVQAMRKMMFGDSSTAGQSAAAGDSTATDVYGFSPSMIKSENVVKQGWLSKQSRYLKTWKR